MNKFHNLIYVSCIIIMYLLRIPYLWLETLTQTQLYTNTGMLTSNFKPKWLVFMRFKKGFKKSFNWFAFWTQTLNTWSMKQILQSFICNSMSGICWSYSWKLLIKKIVSLFLTTTPSSVTCNYHRVKYRVLYRW